MGDGNGFVPLVAVEDLPEDLRVQWEATTRPGLRDFLRMMANAPDHFRRFNVVNAALRADNHLGARLTELVRLAMAQTTRCQVCLAGRAPAAAAEGLTEELVAEIGSDSPRSMTPAEHAAVTFALKFGSDHFSITEADKAALREHFDAEQIVELGLFCALCMVGRFSMLAGLEEQWCPI
jgi:AhpD family alkylhydroperoxidase